MEFWRLKESLSHWGCARVAHAPVDNSIPMHTGQHYLVSELLVTEQQKEDVKLEEKWVGGKCGDQ